MKFKQRTWYYPASFLILPRLSYERYIHAISIGWGFWIWQFSFDDFNDKGLN
jgi:hypothetical protein